MLCFNLGHQNDSTDFDGHCPSSILLNTVRIEDPMHSAFIIAREEMEWWMPAGMWSPV